MTIYGQNQIDWWIYAPVPLITGMLCFVYKDTCRYARFIAALTIVFGVIQSVFLAWTARYLVKATYSYQTLAEFAEFKYLVPISASTLLLICLRCQNFKINSVFSLIRVLMMVALTAALIPCPFIGMCAYDPTLSYCEFIASF
uniref:Serpentine receptor class gamma n=1 Tax=Rhabditophanes sp. KR3021 TaxID=114890 RepID=A0AC35THQ8_9BILA